MTTITAEMQLALADCPAEPLELIDPSNNRVYVLLDKSEYLKLKTRLDMGEFDPRELYPLIAKTAAAAGWADPAMDVYDNYDAEKPRG